MFRSILRNASEKSDVNTNPTGFFHDTPLNKDNDIPEYVFPPSQWYLKVREYWATEGKRAKVDEPPRAPPRLTFGKTYAVHFEFRSPPSAVRSDEEVSPVADSPEPVDIVAANLIPTLIKECAYGLPANFVLVWPMFKNEEGNIGSATLTTLVENVLEMIEAIRENGEGHVADLKTEANFDPYNVEKKYRNLFNKVLDEPAKEGHELTPAQELCMEFSEVRMNMKPRQMRIPHNKAKKANVKFDSTTVNRLTKIAAGLRWLLESPESPARQA